MKLIPIIALALMLAAWVWDEKKKAITERG